VKIFSAMFCCGLLVFAAACTKDAADATDTNENANTAPSAQEELCADYPDNIACPTLPAPPQLEDGTGFSEWEPSQCPAGAMPDFGKPGCIVIGDPCPEGDWPEDLPTDNIRYVTPGGTGDGRTKETAAGSIQQMLNDTGPLSGATPNGYTIALSKGVFEEHLVVNRRQNLIGACVRDTVISGQDPSRDAVVFVTGSGGGMLQNILFTGEANGVWVWNTTTDVMITGVIIEKATNVGLTVSGSKLIADRIVIRDTEPLANGAFGIGLQVDSAAEVDFTRGYLSRNHYIGVLAGMPETEVRLESVIIEDTRSQISNGLGGAALSVQAGGAVQVARAMMLRNQQVGLNAEGVGTNLVLEDVVISETRSQASDLTLGRGVNVQGGAALELRRGLLRNNRDAGAFVLGDASQATFEDLTIEDTLSQESDGIRGRGLGVQGGVVSVTRGLIRRNREVGVLVALSGATAVFEDLLIEDTQSQALDGSLGRGLSAQTGASVSLSRGLIRRNREVGVYLSHDGTSIQMNDTRVMDTRVALCAEDPALTCALEEAQGFGDGILVLGGGHLQLQDTESIDNTRVGLYLYDTDGSGFDGPPNDIYGAPTLDVLRGTITGNQYGINFRQGNITPSDFAGKEVACYDNAATVDGCYSEVELEVPSPSESLEGVTK